MLFKLKGLCKSYKDINILSAKTTPVVLILIVLVSIVIYALSWLLSIAFYKKREI